MKSRKSIQAAEYGDFLRQAPMIDDVLNHDKTVDEICCENPEFTKYLTKERLRELIKYIIEEPEEPQNSQKSCKFPLVASEFFCSDLPLVAKIIFEEPELMRYLFSFVTRQVPVNLLLAGYFLKAFECLLAHNHEELMMIVYQESYHLSLLSHLRSSSIAEIVTLILSSKRPGTEKNEIITEAAKLLKSKDFLVSFNAAGILCKINKDEEIFKDLTNPETLDEILQGLLCDDAVVIRNSGSVVKYLIANAPSETLKAISKIFRELLGKLCEKSKEVLMTQFGAEIKVFGEARLVILEILGQLCGFDELQSMIIERIPEILGLFFVYSWSSYFHHAFLTLIEIVVLLPDLLKALMATDFIENLLKLASENTLTCGNFTTQVGSTGHLYKILNRLVSLNSPEISDKIPPKFQEKLADYNEIESRNVGGKVNINFFDNMSSDHSSEKNEEPDLIPDYPNSKPMTGKDLEELTDLFDSEDKKPEALIIEAEKPEALVLKVEKPVTQALKVEKNEEPTIKVPEACQKSEIDNFTDSNFWKVSHDSNNLADID